MLFFLQKMFFSTKTGLTFGDGRVYKIPELNSTAFSSKMASGILISLIAMNANYSCELISIETYAPNFMDIINFPYSPVPNKRVDLISSCNV